MEQIKLIYQGRRLTSKSSIAHCYGIVSAILPQEDQTLWFTKPLVSCSIGRAFTCERTETGTKGPYKIDFDYRATSEEVRSWSLTDAAATEKRREIIESKNVVRGDIKELVQQVRHLSLSERQSIVKYLITKLL